MKRRIELGKFHTTGKAFEVDLDLILSSNMLVQANSGGGKSWLLRRMIEQTFGLVPQIVVDPEGEFSTLRSKFDLILVGKEGDTPADIRSAQLLAHRLLELGVSAVVDLFEMSPVARPLWVATFIQALVDAPKKLWRELLIYVDEAHMLAPEPGHGAADSDAHRRCRGSLIEMASRGRKRGYGMVAATQRLGKLSKDFAAELKNVLIGQTFIDIDRERALGSLGITKTDKGEFMHAVKNLPPGNFYAMGRALVLEPTRVVIGKVLTEHPQAGRRQEAPPPPTDKIRHLLPQLADLPKEAEQKIATEKELWTRISVLERELRELAVKPTASPGPAVEKRIEISRVPTEWRAAAEETLMLVRQAIGEMTRSIASFSRVLGTRAAPAKKEVCHKSGQLGRRPLRISSVDTSVGETVKIGKGEHQILTAVAQHGENGVTREQLTVLTGYKRSTRDAYIQRLRQAGHVEDGARIVATASGRDLLGPTFKPLPTGMALQAYWMLVLPEGERACLEVVVDGYPDTVEREVVGEVTGYKRSTRDAYLQRLACRELIVVRSGTLRASDMLFH